MKDLRSPMTSLMQDIADLAIERKKAVSDIKAQTASALLTFERERLAMAGTLKAGIVTDRMNRSAEVHEIRHSANKMSHEFKQDHLRMGQNLRKSLVESREFVVDTVSSLCVEFTKERVAFSKFHRKMAKAQRKALRKDCLDRSRAVAELMNSFSNAHQEMAIAQRNSLINGRQERSHAVLEMMKGFHTSNVTQTQVFMIAFEHPLIELEAPIVDFHWPAADVVQEAPDVPHPVAQSAKQMQLEPVVEFKSEPVVVALPVPIKAKVAKEVKHAAPKVWSLKKK